MTPSASVPTVADVWRPSDPPRPLPAFGFRIALLNADGATGAYLELDGRGRFYNYVASQPRPGESVVTMSPDWSLRRADNGAAAFSVRSSDGELVAPNDQVDHGSRPAQDLHCYLTDAAELRCTHEDGDETFVLSVRDGLIAGRMDGTADSHPVTTVEPSPTTDDERRLVLFLWASYMVPSDTGSHDGDSGYFDVGH